VSRLTVLCTLVCLVLVPTAALAAAKAGSYRGVTSASVFSDPGQTAPRTEKGKVTFTVRSNKVVSFSVKGQHLSCGHGTQVIPIAVRTIKLSSAGKGKATYTDPAVGPFQIAITVSSTGKASGKIQPMGLCNHEYPIRFSAKRA
jgi:hypothetical protein